MAPWLPPRKGGWYNGEDQHPDNDWAEYESYEPELTWEYMENGGKRKITITRAPEFFKNRPPCQIVEKNQGHNSKVVPGAGYGLLGLKSPF